MFGEIVSVWMMASVCYLVWRCFPDFRQESDPNKYRDELIHIRTRQMGSKRVAYRMTGKIEQVVRKLEQHQDCEKERAKRDQIHRFVDGVVERLLALPPPNDRSAPRTSPEGSALQTSPEGSALQTSPRGSIGAIVAAICKEIPTVYDHGTTQDEYLYNLAIFIDRAILSNDPDLQQLYAAPHLPDPFGAVHAVDHIPEFADNSWRMLYAYLQKNFDVPADATRMCCCGHHAGMYWPIMKAILFNVPEEKGVVTRWRDMKFVNADDIEL